MAPSTLMRKLTLLTFPSTNMANIEIEDTLTKVKSRGIALATVAGLQALCEKYDLPVSEAQRTFGVAYAETLAATAGEDPDELFGEHMQVLRNL